MKTIFTLLLSTLFSIASFAADGIRLTISSVTSNKMFVEVDGRRYNLDRNTVTIRDIRPGYHIVKVFRDSKKSNTRNFGIRNRREEALYNTRVYLKEGYHFDILVNRFGKVLVDERRIDRNDEWYTDDDDDYYDNDRDRDRNIDPKDRDDDDRYDRNKDNADDDRYDRDEDDTDDDRYDRDNRDPRHNEISDADFSQAKESLKNEWFENTRVSSAKQLIDRNYFTSWQVRDMLMLFTFENNRLDIAKYSYRKTVDKGNYTIMNDAFKMNKNKEELNAFIREQR